MITPGVGTIVPPDLTMSGIVCPPRLRPTVTAPARTPHNSDACSPSRIACTVRLYPLLTALHSYYGYCGRSQWQIPEQQQHLPLQHCSHAVASYYLTECPSRTAQYNIASEYQLPKQPMAMPKSQRKITILLVTSCTSIVATLIVLLWLQQRCTIQLHTQEAASSEHTAGVLRKVLALECRV